MRTLPLALFGISGGYELMVVALVGLLVFGNRLARWGKSVGLGGFKR